MRCCICGRAVPASLVFSKTLCPCDSCYDQYYFLKESNAIEDVHDTDSLIDAIKAWNYVKNKKRMTPSVVKKIHAILMEKHNIPDRLKGQWRDCRVWVGGREGIPYQEIPKQMRRWCRIANEKLVEYQIKDDHVRF
jgi:hypothetical protein